MAKDGSTKALPYGEREEVIHGKAVMIYNFLEIDDIQCFALMIYRSRLRMIYNARGALITRRGGACSSRKALIQDIHGVPR